MFKFKMPEPVAWIAQYGGDVYTEAQLKQVRREALEEAAKVCELFDATNPKRLAMEIRKLMEGL